MLLLMLCITAYSQYISDVQHQPDGSRLICTSSKKFHIGETYYNICIDAIAIDNQKKWILRISSFEYMDEHTEFLIKLGNEEQIFIPVNSVHIDKVIKPGVSFIGNYVAVNYPASQNNYYQSIFIITENQLNQLFDNKIRKIRLYTGKYYEDAVIKGNRLRNLFVHCIKNINKHLERVPDTKNIFDNF